MKRHVRVYLSKGKRSKRKRQDERDRNRKGEGEEGRPVEDSSMTDPAWPVPDRSIVTLKLITFQPCVIVVITGQVPLRVVCALVVTVV